MLAEVQFPSSSTNSS